MSKFDDGDDNDNDSSAQINYVPLLQLALLILVNPFIILLAITIIFVFIRDDFYDEYISLNNDIDLKLIELTNVNVIELGYLIQTSKGKINENITKLIKFNSDLANTLKVFVNEDIHNEYSQLLNKETKRPSTYRKSISLKSRINEFKYIRKKLIFSILSIENINRQEFNTILKNHISNLQDTFDEILNYNYTFVKIHHNPNVINNDKNLKLSFLYSVINDLENDDEHDSYTNLLKVLKLFKKDRKFSYAFSDYKRRNSNENGDSFNDNENLNNENDVNDNENLIVYKNINNDNENKNDNDDVTSYLINQTKIENLPKRGQSEQVFDNDNDDDDYDILSEVEDDESHLSTYNEVDKSTSKANLDILNELKLTIKKPLNVNEEHSKPNANNISNEHSESKEKSEDKDTGIQFKEIDERKDLSTNNNYDESRNQNNLNNDFNTDNLIDESSSSEDESNPINPKMSAVQAAQKALNKI